MNGWEFLDRHAEGASAIYLATLLSVLIGILGNALARSMIGRR